MLPMIMDHTWKEIVLWLYARIQRRIKYRATNNNYDCLKTNLINDSVPGIKQQFNADAKNDNEDGWLNYVHKIRLSWNK